MPILLFLVVSTLAFTLISRINSDAACTEKGKDVEDPFELNAGFAGVTIKPKFLGPSHARDYECWGRVASAYCRVPSLKLSLLCLLLSIIGLVPAAKAQWAASTKGPDIFGNTTGLASAAGSQGRLTVQCDNKDLTVAYITRKKEFEEVKATPANLLVKIDAGEVSSLDASYTNWNDNYAAVAVQDRSATLIAIVKKIGESKATINVGFVINGNQFSDYFPASGSTSAIGKIVQACKL